MFWNIKSNSARLTQQNLFSTVIYRIYEFCMTVLPVVLFICRVTQNSFIVFICHKRLHICAKACFLLIIFFFQFVQKSYPPPKLYQRKWNLLHMYINWLVCIYMCLCVLQKLNMQKPCHLLLFGTSSFRLLRLRFQKKFCNFVLIL